MKWEFRLLDAIRKRHSRFWDRVMTFFTSICNAGLIWHVISLSLILWESTRFAGFCTFFGAIIASGFANLVVKPLVSRDRPCDRRPDLPAKVKACGEEKAAEACGVGVPTLRDVVSELMKPGRDIRDELPKPILRTDVLEMKDLKPGMELTGTVRNVIDFGVFVDIGVHQDGLVHISQVSNKFIKHPSEAVSVGDVVKVLVLDVDEKKKRISLSMKQVKQ
jgi:RecJ-like exonuclease